VTEKFISTSGCFSIRRSKKALDEFPSDEFEPKKFIIIAPSFLKGILKELKS